MCVSVGGTSVLEGCLSDLRDIWEETSFRLERLQVTEACTLEEERGLAKRRAPPFKLTFEPVETPPAFLSPGQWKILISKHGTPGSSDFINIPSTPVVLQCICFGFIIIRTILCAERWCCRSRLLGYWVQSWTGRHSDAGYQHAGTHLADLGRMTGRVNPTWY